MAESNDYWQMLAEQESGLSAEDNNQWAGDVFNSGDDATAYANSPDSGFLSGYLNPQSDLAQTQPDSQQTVDGMMAEQNSGTDFESGFAEQDRNNPLDIVSKGAATVDSFFKSILGSQETQKMYASAISAGIAAIMKSGQNDDYVKYQNADREDKQQHENDLLTRKYGREDEARARKNAVPGAGGRVAYKPQATKGYQVPGAANTNNYGFLKG
jgi:hypothetical protein